MLDPFDTLVEIQGLRRERTAAAKSFVNIHRYDRNRHSIVGLIESTSFYMKAELAFNQIKES